MALLIEDPEVERLAAELAETTGETVDVAVGKALRHELVNQRLNASRKSVEQIMQEIREKMGPLRRLDNRTPEQIIGYNEFGHFD